MGVLNFIISLLFVAFIIFLVVGFNKQMMEKNEKRQEKYKNLKDKNG